MDSMREASDLARPEIEQGHWYRDATGALLIVPDDEWAAAEIEGPDGEMLDRLNKVYRRCKSEGVPFQKIDTAGIARALELEIVDQAERLFDAVTGRYFVSSRGC
jgi:hypothetical protein